MPRRLNVALSSAEMYSLLHEIRRFHPIIRTEAGEIHEVDPMGFNHLPQVMHLYCGCCEKGFITLRLTRFGVDSAGMTVCYPGYFSLSDAAANEQTLTVFEALTALIEQKASGNVTSKYGDVLMLPQAYEMYMMTGAVIG